MLHQQQLTCFGVATFCGSLNGCCPSAPNVQTSEQFVSALEGRIASYSILLYTECQMTSSICDNRDMWFDLSCMTPVLSLFDCS